MTYTNLLYLLCNETEKKCNKFIVLVDLNEYIKYDFVGKSDYVLYFIHGFYFVDSFTFKYFMQCYNYFNSIKEGDIYA